MRHVAIGLLIWGFVFAVIGGLIGLLVLLFTYFPAVSEYGMKGVLVLVVLCMVVVICCTAREMGQAYDPKGKEFRFMGWRITKD